MAGWMIVTVCAVLAAVGMAWRLWRLKRELYHFADKLEENLDNLISGKEMNRTQETEDSLWGKVNEKLIKAAHIWEQKELESRQEKQSIQELISDISHQTKTPVANQRLYLEILKQEEMSEKAKGFLEHMERQTEKLDFLFQSLVKMSRLETGIIRIQKQDADLIETLRGAVASVVPNASAKGIELFVECGEHLWIPHDPKWMEEVIFNILDNAVKYTQNGGEIHVALARQEIFTRISIRDNGKGIQLQRQAQIFTRFYREPEVHNQEGIGVGLYLARKIAELHNGYIEVHSEPGEGTEFRIFLPDQR